MKSITTKKGSCMQTKCQIEKNQLIFTERASAFVPVDHIRICHQCGTSHLIPIPCLHCHGRVNYCSLKCQEKHFDVHVIECPGYRIQLFVGWDIPHLALRTILDDGLYSVLDKLNLGPKSTTYEVWRKLDKDGDVWRNKSIPYAESLRMPTTYFNKNSSNREIKMFALCSHQLVVYLKYYTKYFEVLNARNGNIDWELLTGVLLLRHINQFKNNLHRLTTFIPQPFAFMNTTADHMLNEIVWSSAWRLKLGFLHFFADYADVGLLNLSYLSQCNHSDVQTFTTKFSGRFISTFALRNLKKVEEITNWVDDDDYRKTERENLEENINLKYKGKDHLKKDSKDVDVNKFRQYRCGNTKCGQIFIYSAQTASINFSIPEFSNPAKIFCTICGHQLPMEWHHESKYWISTDSEASSRRRLFQIFKESEKYLVGLNEFKCFLAQQLVTNWFYLTLMNVTLNDQDCKDLIEMLKFILSVTKERYSVISFEYVIGIIYMWDLIAKRKYKCSEADMDEMLMALSIIPDDLKVIFLNYYNDYIKEYYKLQ